MCGRSSLTKNEKEIEAAFGSNFYTEDLTRYNPLPSFNVCPGHTLPILTQNNPTHFKPAKWGSYFSSGDSKMFLVNARSETVFNKKSFEDVARSSRCLVPMDGYYEWLRNNNVSVPYFIKMKSFDLMAAAGLALMDPISNTLHYLILTRPSIGLSTKVHDRMPVFLNKNFWTNWLSSDTKEDLLIDAFQNAIIIPNSIHPVSNRVNKTNVNDISLIQETKNIYSPQQTLF